MVHAFHFSGGRVNYLNRWARTPKFEAEQAAGKPLPMSFVTDPETGAIESDRRNGLANTHIIWHGDQLLALEEGSHPFSMAPDTLVSTGYGHYGVDLQDAMTAHPKIDPLTGDLHGFGYMSGAIGSKTMTYHVIGADGVVKRSERFDAPYAAMVHDFAVTRDYILFPVFPLTFDLDRMGKIGTPFAFDVGAGAYIGVLERDAPVSDIRWIEAPVCFVFITSTPGARAHKLPLMPSISRWHPTSRIPKVICPAMRKRRVASRDGSLTSIPVGLIGSYSWTCRQNFRGSMTGLPWIVTVMDFWRLHLSGSGATEDSFTRLLTSIWRPVSNKSGMPDMGVECQSPYLQSAQSMQMRVPGGY